jgi:F-type H+-transporting ATPase subunit b
MSLLSNPEFWVALGFVAIIAIFVWQGVPSMVAGFLDKRAAAIKSELDEARRLRDEATALLDSYRAKAAKAEEEAAQIFADAKLEAERFASESRTQLKSQLERRSQMARERIAQAEAQAVAEIRAAAADVAARASELLIAAHMDERRAAALVAQSIKDLSDKLA